MSLEYVLKVFNEEEMGNWCERIYNKDGIYKYVTPLIEGVKTTTGTMTYDYLYALQGSRYAHRCYTIQNRFALLDSQYVCGTYRKDSFGCYFGYKFGSDNRKIKITASERYFFGYGYTSGTPHQSAVLAADKGAQVQLTLDTDLIVNDPQYIYGASRIMAYELSNVIYSVQAQNESCNTRAEEIFTQFIKLVEKNFRSERRVGWYSEQLCISPKYLSETIKAVSKRTPNEWIDSYVTIELRMLLRNTQKSIKEIAQELNFSNQSFLGKYFKEHVGMSPSEYRHS